MIEPLLRRLIEHKRRKSIVIILTILTGLLVVLPAADEYNAAKERISVAHSDLDETRGEVLSLPNFEKIFTKKKAQLDLYEERLVSGNSAQKLREEIVGIVRKTGCTMRQIRLGDSARRDWTTKDNAVNGPVASDRGDPTPYQLETRQINLSISGETANVHAFLGKFHQINKMMNTKGLSLKRAAGAENTAQLTMDILLFDLVKKVEE